MFLPQVIHSAPWRCMLAFVGRFAHIPVLLLVIWPPLETLALQDLKQFVLLVLRRDPVEDEEALTWTRATLHAASGERPLKYQSTVTVVMTSKVYNNTSSHQ